MKHAPIDVQSLLANRPAPATRRSVAKLQTRERVLAAAHKVFAEQGYDAATVRDIAQTAGVSMGALFASFAEKSELFDAVLAADFAVLADRMATARAETAGDVLDVLTAMFGAGYARNLEQLPLVQSAMARSWARDSTATVFESAGLEQVLSLLGNTMNEAVWAGEVSPLLDTALAAELLWDGYLSNYRRAVFDGSNHQALCARVRAQAELALCGYLRR
jgi:AcrR family transcriptional regulator